MKRRLSHLLLAMALLASVLVLPAGAALNFSRGTPTVTLTLSGTWEETCYVTLLSEDATYGVWEKVDDFADTYSADEADQTIWEALNAYEDADGFYFLGFYQACSSTSLFMWNYYPPATFKVLVYYPSSNTYLCSSDSYTRYAYDSYYTLTISEDDLTLTQSTTIAGQAASFLLRTVLMIAAALVIAKVMRLEKKPFTLFSSLHAVLVVLLNLFLALVNYRSGASMFMVDAVLLTFVVVMAERWLLGKALAKAATAEQKAPPIRKLTLIANLLGFVINIVAFLFLAVS